MQNSRRSTAGTVPRKPPFMHWIMNHCHRTVCQTIGRFFPLSWRKRFMGRENRSNENVIRFMESFTNSQVIITV